MSLRRPAATSGVTDLLYFFEDCVLDTDRRELQRGGRAVPVEPQVFDVLVCLIQNRERVVSRDDLLTVVWAGRIVSESTLSSRVNAARIAIGDNGEDQRLIRTAQRRGFRFVGAVREEQKIAEPAALAASPPLGSSIAVMAPGLVPAERPGIPLVQVKTAPEKQHLPAGAGTEGAPSVYRPVAPRPSHLTAFIGGGVATALVIGLLGFLFWPSPVAPTKSPSASASASPSPSASATPGQPFDPSVIPLINDADRRGLANYPGRPDAKALAIAYDMIAVVDSAATLDEAKKAALELCQSKTRLLEPAGFWPTKLCRIYAAGPDVVWSRDAVPSAALSDLRAEPLSSRLVPDDVPLVRGNSRRSIADQYMKLGLNKALAITTNGLHHTSDRRGRAEAARMAVEGCAVTSQRPCLVLSVDGFLTIQIPKTRKVDRIFLPSIEDEIPSPHRERIAEVYRGAEWRALAAGRNGAWEAVVGAPSEAAAIEGALEACSRVDRDCQLYAIGNFHVARD